MAEGRNARLINLEAGGMVKVEWREEGISFMENLERYLLRGGVL